MIVDRYISGHWEVFWRFTNLTDRLLQYQGNWYIYNRRNCWSDNFHYPSEGYQHTWGHWQSILQQHWLSIYLLLQEVYSIDHGSSSVTYSIREFLGNCQLPLSNITAFIANIYNCQMLPYNVTVFTANIYNCKMLASETKAFQVLQKKYPLTFLQLQPTFATVKW